MGRHQQKPVSKENNIRSHVKKASKKSTRSHVESDSKKSFPHIDRAYQIYKYLCPILNLSYIDFTKVSEVLSKDKLGDTFIETFIETLYSNLYGYIKSPDINYLINLVSLFKKCQSTLEIDLEMLIKNKKPIGEIEKERKRLLSDISNYIKHSDHNICIKESLNDRQVAMALHKYLQTLIKPDKSPKDTNIDAIYDKLKSLNSKINDHNNKHSPKTGGHFYEGGSGIFGVNDPDYDQRSDIFPEMFPDLDRQQPPVQRHVETQQIPGARHTTSEYQGHGVDEPEAFEQALQRSLEQQEEEQVLQMSLAEQQEREDLERALLHSQQQETEATTSPSSTSSPSSSSSSSSTSSPSSTSNSNLPQITCFICQEEFPLAELNHQCHTNSGETLDSGVCRDCLTTMVEQLTNGQVQCLNPDCVHQVAEVDNSNVNSSIPNTQIEEANQVSLFLSGRIRNLPISAYNYFSGAGLSNWQADSERQMEEHQRQARESSSPNCQQYAQWLQEHPRPRNLQDDFRNITSRFTTMLSNIPFIHQLFSVYSVLVAIFLIFITKPEILSIIGSGIINKLLAVLMMIPWYNFMNYSLLFLTTFQMVPAVFTGTLGYRYESGTMLWGPNSNILPIAIFEAIGYNFGLYIRYRIAIIRDANQLRDWTGRPMTYDNWILRERFTLASWSRVDGQGIRRYIRPFMMTNSRGNQRQASERQASQRQASERPSETDISGPGRVDSSISPRVNLPTGNDNDNYNSVVRDTSRWPENSSRPPPARLRFLPLIRNCPHCGFVAGARDRDGGECHTMRCGYLNTDDPSSRIIMNGRQLGCGRYYCQVCGGPQAPHRYACSYPCRGGRLPDPNR